MQQTLDYQGVTKLKKLYSQMSYSELEAEMKDILDEISKVEFNSQKELLERKYYTAKAYTLHPADFVPGIYRVVGHEYESFELRYVNGIMGWGSIGNETETSFPLSMLSQIE
jgi:hypothetical protein